MLELLDPNRFARGVEPDPAVVQQVMVRRLKDDLQLPDGSPRFPGRSARAIEVTYTDDERTGHEMLVAYTRSRQQVPGAVAVRAGDLISLLLKKRLFSSPAAFARTLDAHMATLARAEKPVVAEDVPDWLTDALAWEDEPDADEAEADVLDRAAIATGALDDAQADLLTRLSTWAVKRGIVWVRLCCSDYAATRGMTLLA